VTNPTAIPFEPSLQNVRELWQRKPALRAIYSDIYRRMLEVSVPGPILEIGGGSGNFKEFAANAVSTDILPAPWLDVVCDAQRLPFAAGSFANVMMIDVLHHIERPVYALAEAGRVLRPGGRLIFCEPAITPLSGPFYRNFHPEPVDMSADPLADGDITLGKDPWLSNQAIPTLLVGRYRKDLARTVPTLIPGKVELFSFLAYPLSGGFRPWSLLPKAMTEPLLKLEWSMRKIMGRLAAFRLLAIYERRD
jgi:SAM-dependent methyltransferase